MGISEQQRMFLEDALLVNTLKTISDSRFGSSRPVYKVASTDEEKGKEFTQKCTEFRSTLKSELRNLAEGYSSRDVEDEPHIQNIRDLAGRLRQSYEEVLNQAELRFGVAQKAVNIYLKYLWRRPRHPPASLPV
jgi:hypothetical protein